MHFISNTPTERKKQCPA